MTSREYDVQGRVTIHVRLPRRAVERLRATPQIAVRLGARDAEPYFTTGDFR